MDKQMERPLKIAMLIQGYYPEVGGAERQLSSLAPRLVAQGLSVTVFTKLKPGLSSIDSVDGVPVHRLEVPNSRVGRSLTFTLKALKGLRNLKPDLIHAHDLFSPSTTALLAKKWLKIPIIVKVVRGGYLGDLQWLGRRTFGQMRVKLLCNHVDRFVVISQEIDQELADLGVPGERRICIPNGVDCSRFSPLSSTERTALRAQLKLPDVPTVIYAGRLAKEKRVEDLLSIWPAIREKYSTAQLIIVGSGDQEVSLMQMKTTGVNFIGAVTDVAPYLKAADIFVLPSVAEGLSNALLEAMATGLSCVATNVGGAQELIKQNQSGILVPPEAPPVLLDSLLMLMKDSAMRESMGRKARAHVKDNYSLDYVAQRLDKLYHDVLQPR